MGVIGEGRGDGNDILYTHRKFSTKIMMAGRDRKKGKVRKGIVCV